MCNTKKVSRTGKASVWVTVVFVLSYSGNFYAGTVSDRGEGQVRIFD